MSHIKYATRFSDLSFVTTMIFEIHRTGIQVIMSVSTSLAMGQAKADETMTRAPKMAGGKTSLARGFHCRPIFFFCPTTVSVL